ncbi:MAG TPA: class 1 fructose-bisphosphatase [Pyrinomonadaceae bacterium]|nr:class 1 fructose-bisphosphatase [Pyrinomonadaceae bacterium]
MITFQQHIVLEQANLPGTPIELQWMLSGIVLATKMIQAQVRSAGLGDILGTFGETNVQGEVQQKLDVYANETLIKCLSIRESIGVIASEENEHPIAVHYDSPNAQYAIVFDPLDGSSNIDIAVTIGTTFSIFRRPEGIDTDDAMQWILQPGRKQIAAGYVIYGSSTVLVYSAGNGVHGFTLDPLVGSYMLTHENIRMPEQGSYYSMNESYIDEFPETYQRFLQKIKSGGLNRFYSSRFIGSLVADFHRTLLRGGIFMYPENKNYLEGRLRLLYEANPIAFIAEQAGGISSNGKQSILDIQPTELHQRTPLIVGGKFEMEQFNSTLLEVK